MACFYFFICDKIDQHGATTDTKMHTIFNKLSGNNLIFPQLIKIWENIYGCAEK